MEIRKAAADTKSEEKRADCLDWNIFQNKAPLKDGNVRLVGGQQPSEGRVEVYYQGQWGTVCDDSWDIADANVVCRSLGFWNATAAVPGAAFGTGSGSILLDNVGCTGTETSLANCRSAGWGVSDCQHKEDAGVRCWPKRDTRSTTTFKMDHQSDLAEELKMLYKSQKDCDMIIKVVSTEDPNMSESVCAHKLILSLGPGKDFLKRMQQSYNYTMKVHSSCFPMVQDFIEFLYKRSIDIPSTMAVCFHMLASEYKVIDLKEYTANLFTWMLPEDNTFQTQVSLFKYAVSTNDLILQENCVRFLAWNCEALINSSLWDELPAAILEALLSRSDVVTPSEEYLFRGVERWIIANRKPEDLNSGSLLLTEESLLQKIRFPMISPENLFDIPFNSSVYKNHTLLFQSKLLEAYQFHTVPPQKLKQSLKRVSEDFVPRIYTSSSWCSMYKGMQSYPQLSYHHRRFQGSQIYTVKETFQTPTYMSQLFVTQMVSWTHAVHTSMDSCRSMGYYCESLPTATLSGPSPSSASFIYHNFILSICKDNYVFAIQEFKKGQAVLSFNGTSTYNFPCQSKDFTYKFVIQPQYKWYN
uniref:Galectin-3-binding protein n=1 Tax=Erpetoichthys calabaricus TaxID=27687 RepID=A0A8C4SYE1_ERPCA